MTIVETKIQRIETSYLDKYLIENKIKKQYKYIKHIEKNMQNKIKKKYKYIEKSIKK